MQQRMIDALEAIPGVQSVGLIDSAPLVAGGYNGSPVFTDEVMDFRPSKAAAQSFVFSISPEYFRAAGTTLLSGRTLTRHDRHRGSGHPLSPATPPYMRVRVRRFRGLGVVIEEAR
jgi:hypothetical protein